MREISVQDITSKVVELFLKANTCVSCDLIDALKQALKQEQSPQGQEILRQIIDNDLYATKMNKPICQDTGMAVCFVELGIDVHLDGDIYDAINEGVRIAYQQGYFRKSIVRDPLDRENTGDNTPAIIHIKLVPGENIKISVMAKGGGSENMSALKMMIPADGIEGIKQFVIDTVKSAGGKPCPPIIVGIGIGGDFENAALMAKQALLREINDINQNPKLAKIEEEIKCAINKEGIGPMGLGGKTTCLAVKIQTAPCHIASMPVAINIQCHVSRHQSDII